VSKASGSSWNYEDLDWGRDDNFCGSQYVTQSPINIDTESLESCPSSNAALKWKFGDAVHYELENTGHDLRIYPINDDGENTGLLQNNFNFDGQHEAYCLSQFHVHWGASEHTINGEAAALEMHFVHYSCKYGSYSAALAAWENDHSLGNVLAVVAVLYVPTKDVEKENIFLKHIVDHAYYVQNHGAKKDLPGSYEYDMNMLIPSNVHNDPKYIHYKGSLTTPSCNPIVDWYVLEDVMFITEDQLNELSTNLYDEDEHLIDHNFRPVQKNTNPVYECGHH